MRLVQRLPGKTLIAVGVLAIAAVALGLGRHFRNGHTLIFNTVPVKHGDLVSTISATGTIEPIEVVDVGAQVAGLILSFGKDRNGNVIDYGSIVEEGTVLAKIDDSVYAADCSLARAQVEQDKAGELSAAASLEQMKAKLIQSEAEWNRAQELTRSKLLATSDFDTYKANYQIAKANVSASDAAIAQAKAATVQAQALLEKAQRNLDFCVIKSPVKGVIIDRRVNIGQTVVSSLNAPSLFLIAKDLTKMQIWVAVNEADVGKIVPGAPVTFECDTFPRREFNGTVGKVRLNATMTQNVVMYTVEVNTENPDNVLFPYLTANVRFVARSETNALLVPNAALRWTPSTLAQVSPDARSWKASEPEAKPSKSARQGKPNSPSQPMGSGRGEGVEGRLGAVWVKDGEFVRPIEVKSGASDGANTAIVSNNLQDGQEVVTGESVETAQAGTQSPFVPQLRKR